MDTVKQALDNIYVEVEKKKVFLAQAGEKFVEVFEHEFTWEKVEDLLVVTSISLETHLQTTIIIFS